MTDTQKKVVNALDQFVDRVLAYGPKKKRKTLPRNVKKTTAAVTTPPSRKKEV